MPGFAQFCGAMGWDQGYTPLTRPRLNTSSVWHKAQTPSNYYYYYYYYFSYTANQEKTEQLRVTEHELDPKFKELKAKEDSGQADANDQEQAAVDPRVEGVGIVVVYCVIQ